MTYVRKIPARDLSPNTLILFEDNVSYIILSNCKEGNKILVKILACLDGKYLLDQRSYLSIEIKGEIIAQGMSIDGATVIK